MGDLKVHSDSKPRHVFIDLMRGAAIFLVVLGRFIQTYSKDGNFDADPLFRLLYSFHMPLFFVISGISAGLAYKTNIDLKLLGKRFLQLILPYSVWLCINFFSYGHYTSTPFLAYLQKVLRSVDYGLWYLWVLFGCYVVLFFVAMLIERVGKRNYVLFALIGISAFFVYTRSTSLLGMELIRSLIPFFLCGYAFGLYKEDFKRKLTINFLMVCALSFFVLLWFWYRNEVPSFLMRFNGMRELFTRIYVIATAFTGMAFFVVVLKTLDYIWLKGILLNLGKASLGIYILQFSFLAYFPPFIQGNYVLILLSTVITTGVTYILTKVLRSSSITAKLLLGEGWK